LDCFCRFICSKIDEFIWSSISFINLGIYFGNNLPFLFMKLLEVDPFYKQRWFVFIGGVIFGYDCIGILFNINKFPGHYITCLFSLILVLFVLIYSAILYLQTSSDNKNLKPIIIQSLIIQTLLGVTLFSEFVK